MFSTMELPSDFYLTLTSDQDMNRFHNNHSSEFLSHLNGPITLDPEKYEGCTIWKKVSSEFAIKNQGRNVKEFIRKASAELKSLKAPLMIMSEPFQAHMRALEMARTQLCFVKGYFILLAVYDMTFHRMANRFQ
jgi:hypothetical protein